MVGARLLTVEVGATDQQREEVRMSHVVVD